MKLKSFLLPLSLIACTAFSALSFADSILIKSTPSLDGDVNSSWGVDTTSHDLTIGKSGIFAPNHKTIITFDTTQVDQTKTIGFAQVELFFTEIPAGMDFIEFTAFLSNNINVEVAGPFGFGGSVSISALDYYATAAATLPPSEILIGFLGNMGIDLTDHINLSGQTQIAISLISNPNNVTVKFRSGEYPSTSGEEPDLTVTYQ